MANFDLFCLSRIYVTFYRQVVIIIMAASQHKLKMQNPQDKWTLREQLCLASAVLRSGDQNWVSVSRAVKPLAEPGLQRPPDFYSQKNCASQYSTLLEQVEAPKRKRGNQGEVESHCEMIARKLTMERIEELKRLVRIDQQNYRRLKAELIKVKSGELDHQLKDMWNEIQAKKKASEEALEAQRKAQEEAEAAKAATQGPVFCIPEVTTGQKGKRPLHQMRQQAPQHLPHLQLPAAAASSAAAQEGIADAAPREIVEGEAPIGPAPLALPLPSPNLPQQQQDARSPAQTPTKTTSYQKQPPPSPLLSSLLKTKHQELAQHGLTQAPLEHDHSSVPQPLPPLTIPPAAATSQHSMLEGSGVMPAPLQSPAAAVGQSQVSPAATAVPSSPSAGAPTLSRLLNKTGPTAHHQKGCQPPLPSPNPLSPPPQSPSHGHPQEMVSTLQSAASQPGQVMTKPPPTTRQQPPVVSSPPQPHVAVQQQAKVKQEPLPEPPPTVQTPPGVPSVTPTPSTPQIKEEPRQVVQEEVVRLKEEPVSQIEATPTSKMDEVKEMPRSTVRRKGQRGRPRGSRRGTRSRARPEPDDGDREADTVEGSDTGDPGKEDTRSEVEYSESEDGRPQDSDDNSSISAAGPHPLAASFQSDSLPSSPASFSQCSDDQETLKAERAWRKAIMMVWRAAASHKYANVFLHPVTDDQAPGYHSIVFRPMDLSTIKKNIETGLIRTTAEFQRDIMLMFQNAIMYNNSDHDVYHMAVEMQRDVMQQIQQFLATQLMVQTADTGKTQLRLRETTRRPEDQQRRGSSEEGGPGKKRRRADDLT
ncbi:bromodomain-containing protein 8-like isoform X4 [Branchiostoma lanceolatum]|uniref:bromodomain-containing protein 8-like isoform X4 n=1 Tax=Branchiostoma lanceolatum TaxID=7740 RepID=UPI003455BD2A